MENEITKNKQLKNKATLIGVSTIGTIGGFISIEHGFFEILQGNIPTNGIKIEAIGEAWRFDGGVGEMALTLIPNYLVTGIIASAIGIITIIWSVLFIRHKYIAFGLFCLSILSLLFGGGVAYFIIALLNSIVATRINKSLTWWRKHMPEKLVTLLAANWKMILCLFVICFILSLSIAIFGLSFIGISDVNPIATNLGFISVALYLISILSGFSYDIQNEYI